MNTFMIGLIPFAFRNALLMFDLTFVLLINVLD